jgi:hypothetical protein
MSAPITYYRNAERPALQLWLLDDNRTLIDFSSGYTFAFKVGALGTVALLTKTANIVGAAGAGAEPTGTPNVVITWTTGELNIVPGGYRWQLVATAGGLDRTFQGDFTILDVVN